MHDDTRHDPAAGDRDQGAVPRQDGDAPRLGDTLGPSRAGRLDRDIGASQGGTPSHDRASFADPLPADVADQVGRAPRAGDTAGDRVAGSWSTTPPAVDPHRDDQLVEKLGDAGGALGRSDNDRPAPMHGAGTPVRREYGDVPAEPAERPGPERIVRTPTTHESHGANTGGGFMDRKDNDRLDASGKGPKTNDIIHHDNHPDVGDHVGEAAGGISGVLTGAAIGSVGGPIGTIIGGIAGAIGGWWSGRAISEAATKFTHSDDDHYRSHYETHPARLADRKYEDVRPAYQLGHLASHNPDYANRDFDAVEGDLRHGWNDDLRAKHGEWEHVRHYARDAYTRGRSGLGTAGATTGATTAGALGGAAAGTHGLADKLDDLKDRVDGNPASRPGADATDSTRRQAGSTGIGTGTGGMSAASDRSLVDRMETGASRTTEGLGDRTERMGDRAENAADRTADKAGSLWDRTKQSAERAGERIADKADDLKDRFDGNPSSRPGVDRTDDPDRRY